MITRADVEAAAGRIAAHVRRTPVLALADGEAAPTGRVTLKLEMTQHTGSFKARGAFNKLLKLGARSPVVAVSGGNHGAAVAYAARKLGTRAEVFTPHFVSAAKVKRMEAFGARVHLVQGDFGDVLTAAGARVEQTGYPLVHAYDDADVIAGQGTAALEFSQQAPFDTMLIAVGGGGLAAGSVAALGGGGARVVAVETEGTAAYRAARDVGAPAPVKVSGIAADSLGAHQIGALPFALLQAANVASVLVTDEAVLAAQLWLWGSLRIASEPGGATAFAALLNGAYTPAADERVGVLICGANTDLGWAR